MTTTKEKPIRLTRAQAKKRDIIKCWGCGRLSTPIEWETNRMHPEACPHCGGIYIYNSEFRSVK